MRSGDNGESSTESNKLGQARANLTTLLAYSKLPREQVDLAQLKATLLSFDGLRELVKLDPNGKETAALYDLLHHPIMERIELGIRETRDGPLYSQLDATLYLVDSLIDDKTLFRHSETIVPFMNLFKSLIKKQNFSISSGSLLFLMLNRLVPLVTAHQDQGIIPFLDLIEFLIPHIHLPGSKLKTTGRISLPKIPMLYFYRFTPKLTSLGIGKIEYLSSEPLAYTIIKVCKHTTLIEYLRLLSLLELDDKKVAKYLMGTPPYDPMSQKLEKKYIRARLNRTENELYNTKEWKDYEKECREEYCRFVEEEPSLFSRYMKPESYIDLLKSKHPNPEIPDRIQKIYHLVSQSFIPLELRKALLSEANDVFNYIRTFPADKQSEIFQECDNAQTPLGLFFQLASSRFQLKIIGGPGRFDKSLITEQIRRLGGNATERTPLLDLK